MRTQFKKKCPRCQNKIMASLKTCPHCSMDFEKFYTATNKEAKQAIREGEKHRVLMRMGVPSDVKMYKLLLMSIFLGFLGGHHYYVGRWKMGLAYSMFFIIGCVNGVLTTLFKGSMVGGVFAILELLVLGWGLILILWILDVIKIIFNRYKIPVGRKE